MPSWLAEEMEALDASESIVQGGRSSQNSKSSQSSRSNANRSTAEPTRSKKNDRRRERTKARAEKMYSKQFAAESESANAVEGAPRAAVYEAQMGAKHRKSSRMQRASAAEASSAKVNLAGMAGWLSTLPITARSLRVATAVVCVFLFCVLLYPPAQQYYQAQREHDKLAAEYSAIEYRNTALDDQNDILASDAGMEDAVRQKFGYVKAGEQVAYVAGLSEGGAATRRDSDDLQANVISSTVKAPNEWYTPLLDAFFGVE